jgi:hypothetical protein
MEMHCTQNKVLKKDARKFYGNLGTKTIDTREPPSMAESEPYWK